MELYQYFNEDLVLDVNGRLKMASGELETQQRIYRRLLTPTGSYLWHLDYGAGLPQYIGKNLTPALEKQIKGKIKTNMFLESTVVQSPEPTIDLEQTSQGLQCLIRYTSKPSGNVYTLSFTVEN